MPKRNPPSPTSADAIDDSLIPYYSHAIKERLGEHALTQEFIDGLFAITGGGFKEEQGGNWERVRLASEALRTLEEKAPKKAKDRLASKAQRLPFDRRQLLDTHAKVAGITFHWTSPALTTGEVAYLSRACDWIEISDIDDVIECITTAFPGTVEVPSSASLPADCSGTEEGATERAASSSEPAAKRKRKLVIDGGVVVPEGYTDQAIDLGGTTAEVKARVNEIIHATFIAELHGKNRAGITEWLMKTKLKGFRIPEDWRTDDEIEEAA